MEPSLQEKFIQQLEHRYGKRDELTSHFGTTPFGQVAKDLSISSSQFTKLITGSATEGMYLRSIENVDRLITTQQLQQKILVLDHQLQELSQPQIADSNTRIGNNKWIFFLSGIILSVILLFLINQIGLFKSDQQIADQHPLAAYFDYDFNSEVPFASPYLDDSEVQDYCPASAYEGVWSLAQPYKLPLPSSKPGVYYTGVSADVRMKVFKTDTSYKKGHVLLAYEYLVNEIWIDTKRTPLSPTYFDKATKTYTPTFDQLDFSQNPQFKKVASIHSFFQSKITIRNGSIFREGEPCGRFATDVDQNLASEYEIDPEYILENVLSDLTTTSCASFANPYCNPNDLKEGESIINFDCLYTIRSENLGFGGGYPYRKGFKLEKQMYSNNLTCNCEE